MTLASNLHQVTLETNSPIIFPIREDGVAVSTDGVTRCDMVFKKDGAQSVNVSSSAHAGWFTLQHDDIVDGRATKVIRVDLKDVDDAGVTVGRYEVDLYVFDATNTEGRFVGTIDVDVNPANPAAA